MNRRTVVVLLALALAVAGAVGLGAGMLLSWALLRTRPAAAQPAAENPGPEAIRGAGAGGVLTFAGRVAGLSYSGPDARQQIFHDFERARPLLILKCRTDAGAFEVYGTFPEQHVNDLGWYRRLKEGDPVAVRGRYVGNDDLLRSGIVMLDGCELVAAGR